MKKTIMFLLILTSTTLFGMNRQPELASLDKENYRDGRKAVIKENNSTLIDKRYDFSLSGSFDAIFPSREQGHGDIWFNTPKIANFCHFFLLPASNVGRATISGSNNDTCFVTLGQHIIEPYLKDTGSILIKFANDRPFKTYRFTYYTISECHKINELRFGYQE